MKISIQKTNTDQISAFRDLYLQECNFEIRYNACFEREWADCYLLVMDNITIGYGAIKGQEIKNRDTIFEFFIIKPYRKYAPSLLEEFIKIPGVKFLECQSNDLQYAAVFFEFASGINSDTILFEDNHVTNYTIPGVIFRRRNNTDIIFKHTFEPSGDFVLETDGEVIATGGYMLHYNPPFADLYMEVKSGYQQKGYAALLLQELKKSCYANGRVPAARCSIKNHASKGALIKAGFKISGFMLLGELKGIVPAI